MKWLGWALIASGPVALGVWWLAGLSPGLVESWYSRGLYPFFMAPWSRWWASIDFPVAAVVLGILVVVFVAALVAVGLGRTLWGTTCVVSFLLAWFVLGWGLNYQRESWAASHQWSARGGTLDELQSLAERLSQSLGSLRAQIAAGGPQDWSVARLRDSLSAAYELAGHSDAALAGSFGSPKAFPYSEVLSWGGIAGIFIPHFGEPLVNTGPADWQTPFVAAHELAHLHGFAREDEANFLAYWVLRNAPDPRLRYSARATALLYVVSAMLETGPEGLTRWNALKPSVDPRVLGDWKSNRDYWDRFKGPLREAVQTVNDAYLKTQGAADGVKSYGRMVDLLLAAPE